MNIIFCEQFMPNQLKKNNDINKYTKIGFKVLGYAVNNNSSTTPLGFILKIIGESFYQ